MTLSCTESVIYQNNSYTLYPDKVIQGEYTAEVCSPYKVVSDFGGDTLVWEKKNDLSTAALCKCNCSVRFI